MQRRQQGRRPPARQTVLHGALHGGFISFISGSRVGPVARVGRVEGAEELDSVRQRQVQQALPRQGGRGGDGRWRGWGGWGSKGAEEAALGRSEECQDTLCLTRLRKTQQGGRRRRRGCKGRSEAALSSGGAGGEHTCVARPRLPLAEPPPVRELIVRRPLKLGGRHSLQQLWDGPKAMVICLQLPQQGQALHHRAGLPNQGVQVITVHSVYPPAPTEQETVGLGQVRKHHSPVQL